MSVPPEPEGVDADKGTASDTTDAGLSDTTAESASTRRICPTCEEQYDDAKLNRCPKDGAFLAMFDDYLAGTTLDRRYELLALIGKGGMGAVYRARDLLMKREVAIKLVHKHLIANPQTIGRFQQEAQAASALSHGNVVVAHDYGVTSEGIPYLVLDYLDGTTLAQEISVGSSLVDLERFLRIFNQICDGLAAAHERGVVHRDIKPGNIMLLNVGGQSEVARIMDFGIAKILQDDEDTLQRLTRTGEIFGSPLYMSPEQISGSQVDARSDIYALGCVMYETLTGNPPHAGASAFETLTKHLSDKPAAIAEVRSDIASIKRLEQIIFKTLAKQPSDRYDSVTDLKDDLERLSRSQLLRGESQAQVISSGRINLLPHWFPLDSTLKVGIPVAVVSLVVVLGGYRALTAPLPPQSIFLLVIIACAISLFFLSLKLFGPNGTLHKLSLESYVPLQFRPSQQEVLNRLTAPWKPGALTLGIFKQIEIPPVRRLLTLSAEERQQWRHVLVVGKAGTGKTTLLSKFMMEEIASNKSAVVLLDFAGDLSQQLSELSSSQPHAERYHFVDLCESNCQIGLAPQDLLSGFANPIARKIAAKAIAFSIATDDTGGMLLESSTQLLEDSLELLFGCGGSLTDLPNILRSSEELKRLINKANSDSTLADIGETWKLYESTIGTEAWNLMLLPVMDRVDPMMRDVRIRKLLSAQSNKLSLRDIVLDRRILVLKLPRDHFTTKASKLSSVFLFCLIETLSALSHETGVQNGCSLFMDMIEKAVNTEMLEKVLRKDNRLDLFTCSTMRSLQEFDDNFRNRLLQQQSLLCVFAPNLRDAQLLAPIMFRLGHAVLTPSMTELLVKPKASQAQGFAVAVEDHRLHVDRLIAQEPGSYFAYLTGTVAGIFKVTSSQHHIDASLPGIGTTKRL